jgi:hypothetical protein
MSLEPETQLPWSNEGRWAFTSHGSWSGRIYVASVAHLEPTFRATFRGSSGTGESITCLKRPNLPMSLRDSETALPHPSSISIRLVWGVICQELLGVSSLIFSRACMGAVEGCPTNGVWCSKRETFQGSLHYPAASIAPRTCMRSNPMFDHDAECASQRSSRSGPILPRGLADQVVARVTAASEYQGSAITSPSPTQSLPCYCSYCWTQLDPYRYFACHRQAPERNE